MKGSIFALTLLAPWLPSSHAAETIEDVMLDVAKLEAKKYNMSIAIAFFQNASSIGSRSVSDKNLFTVAAGQAAYVLLAGLLFKPNIKILCAHGLVIVFYIPREFVLVVLYLELVCPLHDLYTN